MVVYNYHWAWQIHRIGDTKYTIYFSNEAGRREELAAWWRCAINLVLEGWVKCGEVLPWPIIKGYQHGQQVTINDNTMFPCLFLTCSIQECGFTNYIRYLHSWRELLLTCMHACISSIQSQTPPPQNFIHVGILNLVLSSNGVTSRPTTTNNNNNNIKKTWNRAIMLIKRSPH